MSEIFIASSSLDESTYGAVVRKLEDKGFDVFVYNADKVLSGLDRLSITTISNGGLNFSYNGETKNLYEVSASWYRQPNVAGIVENDKAKQLSLELEIKKLQEAIWQMIPGESWLNSPENIENAQIKLGQLATASFLGFNIPRTVVSNNWESIDANLDDDIIVKMSKGVLYENNQTQVLYTTRLNSAEREDLRLSLPFPAIFQNYAKKTKEWRVTVIGDRIFEVAIYTSDDAKDDWRKHQFTKKVNFKIEELDSDTKQKCIQFLEQYDLRYGAFDLVEDQEGKITFLECNPNGQFMWLEEMLHLPISDAIADELAKISSN
jgi:glutathione synthase/RimK-type ligase-like ATP-grasp enzyme